MVLAFIQARMGSTRLPGKVLKLLCGRPVIQHVVERVQAASLVDQVMVVTSIDPNNLPLINHVSGIGVPLFVGSEDDVLDRFWQATRLTAADHIVRITADCPIMDPTMIDRVVEAHLANGNAYTSNIDPPTWPDGLDVEVITRGALEIAWVEATEAHEREHVTPYLRNNPARFASENVASDVDLSGHRWTLDQEEDYRFLEAVYLHLGDTEKLFGMREILKLLSEQTELQEINAFIDRNVGAHVTPTESE